MSKSNNIYIQKARKKRRIKRIIYLTILFIIVSVLVAWKSSIFSINDIKIEGDTVITGSFVSQETDCLKGDNILLISKDDITSKLLNNPYISEVNISRELPKTLIINITEAKGLYYFCEDKSTYSIISDNLVLLERTKTKNNDLVELKGFETKGKELGDKLSEDTRIYKILNEFYREQQTIINNGEKFRIVSLDLENLSDIKVQIDKITIYLGNDENIRKKMSDAIQVYKSGKVTEYIKVGFNGAPDFK